MDLMPYTTTATELQRNYKKVAKRARQVGDVVIVLSNNRPEGVYIDYNSFITKYMPVVNRKVVKNGRGMDAVFGAWTVEEAEEFNKIIEDAFERVDPKEWK